MNQYALLTIGKTHSGKSTFANDLILDIPNGIILETDSVALFLHTAFPKLHSVDLKHPGGFSPPSLKFMIFQEILKFSLEQKLNIILSNANMFQDGREHMLGMLKRYPTETIGVYFNYPEEVLVERVKHSGRDTRVLTVSKDFEELIVKQRARFQVPNENDFDHFFEIRDPSELDELKGKLIELYRK